MIDEFEILSPHEDLVARRRDWLFQTEEFRLGREIERTGAALAANRDLVGPIANDLAGNFELGGGAERIIRADLFGRYRFSVDHQLVSHLRLDFPGGAQI